MAKTPNPKVQDDVITSKNVTTTPTEVMAGDNITAQPDETAAKRSGWQPKGEERKVWEQFRRRKDALLQSRFNVYGLNIDAEMRRFDKKYFRRQADIPASELDANQRPLAINTAYGKVQTALGILIDSSPSYVLESDNPKYSGNRALLKALAEKSFRNTNSLGQFKLSVFNSAKRGWFIGRTFNRRLQHDARFLSSVDHKGKRAYETRLVTKMDDVAYQNLNNFNTWIDEQTRPEDFYSTRDWMWREVWYIDDLRRMFPVDLFPNMAHVRAGGDTRESIQGVFTRNTSNLTGVSPQTQKRGMTEVFFYENQYADQFIVEANGVMIVWEPLPQNNKRLSCTYGQWSLRGDDTIYGIGMVEAMENDEELVDRILNMDMRQLLLTISPMGFYSGTEDFEDENIRISPGILRRTMNPRDISWLTIPQTNNSGLEKITWLKSQQDAKTGIIPAIEGHNPDQPGDLTAFQVGVDREAALKRLSLPLKSLQYALSWEFENRISLIQQVYSKAEVEHIASQEDINAYLDEIKIDPTFYYIENEGQTGKEKFYALRYPQISLSLERNEDGEFVESEVEKFFQILPEMLVFTGNVTVDASSLLTTSKALDQANTLRMVNLLAPLLQGPVQTNALMAKQLLKSFDYDPRDWLPKDWITYLTTGKIPQPQTPAGPAANAMQGATGTAATAQTVVPPAQVQSGPSESGINGAAFDTGQ